ncbi:Uncharacterised protein [Mycobacterium tuberculosis]|nr:Uncharacterised protein [Mycobacterium tuberculosis]
MPGAKCRRSTPVRTPRPPHPAPQRKPPHHRRDPRRSCRGRAEPSQRSDRCRPPPRRDAPAKRPLPAPASCAGAHAGGRGRRPPPRWSRFGSYSEGPAARNRPHGARRRRPDPRKAGLPAASQPLPGRLACRQATARSPGRLPARHCGSGENLDDGLRPRRAGLEYANPWGRHPTAVAPRPASCAARAVPAG